MMRLGHHGALVLPASAASCASLARRVSQASSSSTERQFGVGKEPTTPLAHAADTSSMPLTRSIGAAMSGSERRWAKGRRDAGAVTVN